MAELLRLVWLFLWKNISDKVTTKFISTLKRNLNHQLSFQLANFDKLLNHFNDDLNFFVIIFCNDMRLNNCPFSHFKIFNTHFFDFFSKNPKCQQLMSSLGLQMLGGFFDSGKTSETCNLNHVFVKLGQP